MTFDPKLKFLLESELDSGSGLARKGDLWLAS